MKRQSLFLTAAVLLLGCPPSTTRVMEPPPEVTATADAIARAQAYHDRMAYVAEKEPEAPVRTVKPDLDLQGEALDKAKSDHAAEGRAWVAQEKVLAGERDAWKGKYDGEVEDFREFRGKLSVRIAIGVEHFIITVAIVWVAAGIAGTVLTACGGFGFAGLFNVGRWLLSFLPLANVFTGFSHMIEDHWPGVGKKWSSPNG